MLSSPLSLIELGSTFHHKIERRQAKRALVELFGDSGHYVRRCHNIHMLIRSEEADVPQFGGRDAWVRLQLEVIHTLLKVCAETLRELIGRLCRYD